MKNTYTIETDTIEENAWSQVVEKFDDASLYSTWAYGAVRWGEAHLSHCILKRDGDIVAAAQARIMKIPYFNTGIAYVYWGPLWRVRGREKNTEIFQRMIGALHDEYVGRRGLYLRIVPNIIGDNSDEIVAILEKWKFKKQSSVKLYRTLLLDMSLDAEDLRKNLKQKWRGHLNKAERMDFNVIEGTDDSLFETFIHIYHEMNARKKYVDYVDIEEFREIQKKLPDKFKMRILIGERSGKPITGLIWSAIGDTGTAIFSGTKNEGMKYGGSYLLRWHMIMKLKERGHVFLDQGGINPERNPGSYKFKVGMGGKDVNGIGQYDSSGNILNSALIKYAELLRAHFRKSKDYYFKQLWRFR